MVRGFVGVLVVVVAPACAIGARAAREPKGTDPVVIVGSAALPQPIRDIARHPWVSLRPGGSRTWERWEVMCCPDRSQFSTVKRTRIRPTSDHGGSGGDVRFHAVIRGKRAAKIIACVRKKAPTYPHRNSYLVWPGPNSNTFVDWLVRACGINTELPAPSIGRNYRGLIGLSWSAGGTGFQLDTYLFGFKLGLTEGIELHVLGLTIGIDWWPPAIIVPVGPGRIGFDDR